MRTIVTFVFVLASLAGCSAPSVNLQMATLRASGDATATLILDHKDQEKVERTRAKITGIAEGVEKFLARGEVAGLTTSEIRNEVLRLVPAKYRSWAEQLVNVVQTRQVDVQRIGPTTVALLRAFVQGTLTGAGEYRKDLRQPDVRPEPATGSFATEDGT